MGLGPRYLDSPRALVVLRPMRLPVPKAHPAEVVLAVVALHVVAAAVLLDADAALRTLKKHNGFIPMALNEKGGARYDLYGFH
jgi:hypothetical protein